MRADEVLFPAPRSATTDGAAFAASPVVVSPSLAGEPLPTRVLQTLLGAMSSFGASPEISEEEASVRCVLDFDLPDQAYRLDVGANEITLRASGPRGLFYAAGTLHQWCAANASEEQLPPLHVDDAPDFAVRGVMLDVSRNKVPTLATLLELVDRLAELKINHLQLYTEHTFAYVGHEDVWRGWSPFSAEDMRLLDAYCLERFVELAPNQNSFGHLHRWLVHPRYLPLAECPEGIEHPFGFSREPFSLCPLEPGSFALLEDLYDQLLPCFTSPLFNVGLDETFDLGEGRSAAACRERGKGRVYLEFLDTVHRLVADRGRRMLFWGDIILESPELIPELPADSVALEWGYEADHPFESNGQHFADSGLEHWVCPGTSSWNSLGGRTSNSQQNLASAAAAGRAHGAAGYLITDWGDFGHLQPLPVSYPGFVAGAGQSWSGRAEAPDVQRTVDRVFGCPRLGELLFELGDVHRHSGATLRNHTVLFQLFNFHHREMDHPVWNGLTQSGLERCIADLHDLGSRAAALADPLIAREVEWACELLRFSADLGRSRLSEKNSIEALPADVRATAASQLGEIEARLAPLWLARNRPGGLASSRARFRSLGAALRG
ncbi:MAG: family 20 glycosylhydrolase [Acidobacteriota bacterium]